MIFSKNYRLSDKDNFKNVYSNTLIGIEFFHFMAFSPFLERPHPLWAFDQQQTVRFQVSHSRYNVSAQAARFKDHGILHLTVSTGLHKALDCVFIYANGCSTADRIQPNLRFLYCPRSTLCS